MTTQVDASVLVNRPVSVVYNQWTQFEEFPHFMGGVSKVTQLDDRTLEWVAEIAGVKRQWKATILEQVPDTRIAWAAVEGATNAGAVSFEPAGTEQTTVRLHLEYEPEGLVETAGDKLQLVQRQAESDLKRFKEFIEDEGYSTGAWRGAINPGVGIGEPGVGAAVLSEGDKGKAGFSGKVIAGAAATAGAALAKTVAGRGKEAIALAKARRDRAEAAKAGRTPPEHTHDSWIGRTVYDRKGEKVGSITDIFYDDVSGQPEWLTVSTGWFGTNESFVPIAGTALQGDDLRVDWDAEVIKGAPTRGADSHIDDAEEERLYAHYGFNPSGTDYETRFGNRPRADEGYTYYEVRGRNSSVLGSTVSGTGEGGTAEGGTAGGGTAGGGTAGGGSTGSSGSSGRLRPYRSEVPQKRRIGSRQGDSLDRGTGSNPS